MNIKLTEEIIKNIYKNLGVKVSGYESSYNSIMQPEYVLHHKIKYDDGDQRNVWGVQINVKDSAIKIMLADCTQDSVPEYCLLVSITDSPTYACYLAYNTGSSMEDYVYPMIACSVSDNSWAECSIFLQATFLAGMERIRDITTPTTSLVDSEAMYLSLLNFIDFYQQRYDEGQESR